MKKLLLLPVFTFLASFFFVSSVFATSGCCSSHGGVNCAAGAQANGHVICNDGWTGSSCLYSSMVMCGGSSGGSTYTAPTPTPTPVPVYVPPAEIIEEPTSTPTPRPTATPTPKPTATLTPTPPPTIEATPTPTPTNTPTPTVKGVSTEPLVWKFHWWNFSPLMGFLGFIFQWK